MPIVLEGDSLEASRALLEELKEGEGGISNIELDKIIQAGNFIPPAPANTNDEDYRERLEADALERILERQEGKDVAFKAAEKNGARFLRREKIGRYAPKFAFLLDRLATCEGVAFVYMRAVNLGALPLALCLEANGYTLYGRSSGLLVDGIQDGLGRQCALCKRREANHAGKKHAFAPAYYGLLTGDEKLSPQNRDTIAAERSVGNEYGAIMKVIIGSQIAGEGVDLRYVREVHVIDSWYHLNKTEQVIGRAIRFCSHSALPVEKRNATIYLYCAVFPEGDSDRETGELYNYRQSFHKAVLVGNVTRALKIHAIDCNLNHDAIIIQGQDPIEQIDSQRVIRDDVDINDKPFTAICDWDDSCDYECGTKIKIDLKTADDSTYSEFAAKWRIASLKNQFRKLFSEQPFYEFTTLWKDIFADVPVAARTELFSSVVDNKTFQVTYNGINGYVKYCNGYYVFQPNVYADLHIPMAIRAASFPVRRDHFEGELVAIEAVRTPAVAATASRYSLKQIWKSIVEWHADISSKKPFPPTTSEIRYRIETMSNREPEVIKKYRNIMETFEWFHGAFLKSGGSGSTLRRIILEFIWDNWFNVREQIELLGEEGADDMVKEEQISLGRTEVVRLFNPSDGKVVYMCHSALCSSAVIKDIKKRYEKGMETLFDAQEGDWKTGETYGFLSTHSGEVVFKTNSAPIPGSEKKLKGIMCSVLSCKSDRQAKLLALGKLLRRLEKPDAELNKDLSLENAVRGCTLLELALRYMDVERIQGSRWFYRPVTAVLLGHGGYFKKGSKGITITAETLEKSKAASPEEESPEAGSEEESPEAGSEEESPEEESPEVKPKKLLRRSKTVKI